MQRLTRPRTRPNVFDRLTSPNLPVLKTAVLAVILALVSPGSAGAAPTPERSVVSTGTFDEVDGPQTPPATYV